MAIRSDIVLFPQGRAKAFTMSYDDGVTQDIRLMGLMDRYGLKGTFNLNSGVFGNKDSIDKFPHPAPHHKIERENIAQVYKNHEIAVHGRTHLNLAAAPKPVVLLELLQDKIDLESIAGYPIHGCAYAFGLYDDQARHVLKELDIDYARTVVSTHDFKQPQDYLQWHPTCHHDDGKLDEITAAFLADDDGWIPKTKLFYFWGHSYEFDGNDNWDHIENFLKKISGRDDVWYATNGEIVAYLKAAAQLRYSADGSMVENPTCLDVWLNIWGKVYRVRSGETVKITA